MLKNTLFSFFPQYWAILQFKLLPDCLYVLNFIRNSSDWHSNCLKMEIFLITNLEQNFDIDILNQYVF